MNVQLTEKNGVMIPMVDEQDKKKITKTSFVELAFSHLNFTCCSIS